MGIWESRSLRQNTKRAESSRFQNSDKISIFFISPIFSIRPHWDPSSFDGPPRTPTSPDFIVAAEHVVATTNSQRSAPKFLDFFISDENMTTRNDRKCNTKVEQCGPHRQVSPPI